MRKGVPPMARLLAPVKAFIISGKTAIMPKNSAPTRVMRVKTLAMCSEVGLPGLTPGMKAPDFCRLVEMESGSKVTAV